MKSFFFVFAAVCVVFLLPFVWDSNEPIPQYISIGTLVVFILIWMLVHAWSGRSFVVPKFIFPWLAFLTWQTLWLLVAPVPIYGVQWITIELGFLLIFLFVVDTSRTRQTARHWETALIIVALFFALFDLLIIGGWYAGWRSINGSWLPLPPISQRADGFFLGQPNLLSAYLNIAIPLVLMRILDYGRRSQRILWIEVLLLLLITQYFTSSRGGWLALSGAVILMIILYYFPLLRISKENFAPVRNLSRKTIWLGGAVFVAGLALVPILIRQVSLTAHGTFAERLDVWQYALKQISRSPVWGNGTGSLAFLYALRSQAIGGDEVFHAHNLWLQITAESGLIGLILVLFSVGLLTRVFITSWHNTNLGSEQRNSLIAYIGVVTAVIIHSILDFVFWRLMITIGILIILALLFRIAPRREYLQVKKRTVIPLLSVLLIGFSFVALVYLYGSLIYSRGVKAASNGNWQNAQQEICAAARANPSKSFYNFQCSLASAFTAYQENDPQALHSAIHFQQKGLEQDPFWYMHWANLASYEWQVGKYEQAIEHMQKAVNLAPAKDFLWLNLAWMQENSGLLDQAKQNYHITLCLNPWYQETSLFAQSELFQSVQGMDCPDHMNAAEKNAYNQNLWEGWMALKSDDLSHAESFFQQAIITNPNNPVAYSYLARVHQQEGMSTRQGKILTLPY